MSRFLCLSLPGAGGDPQGNMKDPMAISTGKTPCLIVAESYGGAGLPPASSLHRDHFTLETQIRAATKGCFSPPVLLAAPNDCPSQVEKHREPTQKLFLAQSDRDGLRRRNSDPGLPLAFSCHSGVAYL